MRIDGTTVAETHLDEDTGGIILRRLHPRIASYNDLVIFLMKSNMDIKFIGSGEAAKALLHYITDYITKPSLPMHIGLGAMSYAIQKTNEKFPHMSKDTLSGAATLPHRKGALNVTVNRMISRQEISHQQVMSYLVGGGDVYRSHSFAVMHWGAFDRFFRKHFHEEQAHNDADLPAPGNVDDDCETYTLEMKPGSISASSQRQDYIYRSTDAQFDCLCLYEFVGGVRKMTKTSEKARHTQRGGGVNGRGAPAEGGRDAQPRGLFCSEEHTQFHTHILRRRAKQQVPVILGERIPRSDRGEEEREAWARMMLILFIPWRAPSDLRAPEESWATAYERRCSSIPQRHLQIIAHMNVLSECRDVRDAVRDLRRAEALTFMKSGIPAESMNRHSGRDDEDLSQDFQLFDKPGVYDSYESVNDPKTSHAQLDSRIGTRGREMLDYCFGGPGEPRGATGSCNTLQPRNDTADGSALEKHASIMRSLKKQRRPTVDTESDDPRPRKRPKVRHLQESTTTAFLREGESKASTHSPEVQRLVASMTEQVVAEMGLQSNPEQERAFRIVAEHVQKGEDQLLMYIAGVGGTGKTHVIKAFLRLFQLLGR
ncbi:hypothetical protein OH77DRAFT_1368236, partial [Trametes cingulata]